MVPKKRETSNLLAIFQEDADEEEDKEDQKAPADTLLQEPNSFRFSSRENT